MDSLEQKAEEILLGSKIDQDNFDDILPRASASVEDKIAAVESAASRGLVGDHTPQYVKQREQFHHREMCYLRAQGFTPIEIAERLGFSSVCVRDTLKQPWAQEMVLDLMSRAGAKEVVEIFQRAAPSSALRLIELAESAENPEIKRKANNDILNRFLGMPNQPHSYSDAKDPSKMSDAEIAQEIQRLKDRQPN